MKATGFFRALERGRKTAEAVGDVAREGGAGVKLLLVDNDDCFIHTLSNYARQTGAEVVTYRTGFPLELIEQIAPGPDSGVARSRDVPRDFGVPRLVRHAVRLGIPVFGVCLGLQGMVEAFGGELGVLDYPDARQAVAGDDIAGSECSKDCRRNSRSAAIIRCTRSREKLPGVPGSHRGDRKTA